MMDASAQLNRTMRIHSDESFASRLKRSGFAALTAAIVASQQANSISTIFSLDLYKKYIRKDASERNIVRTGRWAVLISMVLAGIVAPALSTLDQAYQFIQEYIGFIAPGVLAIFLMGLFWKKTTSAAALAGALLTIPVSTILKFLPSFTDGAFPDYPFIDRMSITFVLIVVVSSDEPGSPEKENPRHQRNDGCSE
jgi:SSS family solute:Na+ symporter